MVGCDKDSDILAQVGNSYLCSCSAFSSAKPCSEVAHKNLLMSSPAPLTVLRNNEENSVLDNSLSLLPLGGL